MIFIQEIISAKLLSIPRSYFCNKNIFIKTIAIDYPLEKSEIRKSAQEIP